MQFNVTEVKLESFRIITYRKRRKSRGVINFVVFADATIPQNLILGQQFTQMAGTRISYNAEHNANSRQSRILLQASPQFFTA